MGVVGVPLAVVLRRPGATAPAADPAPGRRDAGTGRGRLGAGGAPRSPCTVGQRRALAAPPRPPARPGPASASRCCCRCATRPTGSPACLRALLAAARRARAARSLVLDDGSTDGTADGCARGRRRPAGPAAHRASPRRPAGWASRTPATSSPTRADPAADVLVFVDADVALAPHAVAATWTCCARRGSTSSAPYPRPGAGTRGRAAGAAAAAVVVADLPAAAGRRALAAAVAGRGQRAAARRRRAGYRRAGGHAAVRTEVLDDIALPRAVKRAGGRGASPTARGSRRAGCTRAGPSCATATPSRCGRRSGRRPARPRWPRCSCSATCCRRWCARSAALAAGCAGVAAGLAARRTRGRRRPGRSAARSRGRGRGWPRRRCAHPVSVAAARLADRPVVSIAARRPRRAERWPSSGATGRLRRPPREPRRGRRRRARRAGGRGPAGRRAATRSRVLEQADTVGGKLGRLDGTAAGFRFDTGPSLVTMPQVFARLFDDTGAPLHDVPRPGAARPAVRLPLRRRHRSTCRRRPGRIAPGSDAALGDRRRRATGAAVAAAPSGCGRRRTALPGVAGLLAARLAALALAGPRPARRRARPQPARAGRAATCATRGCGMLLDRYATYSGSDPRRAPAALAVVPYVEQAFGGWYLRGGLGTLADALAAPVPDAGRDDPHRGRGDRDRRRPAGGSRGVRARRRRRGRAGRRGRRERRRATVYRRPAAPRRRRLRRLARPRRRRRGSCCCSGSAGAPRACPPQRALPRPATTPSSTRSSATRPRPAGRPDRLRHASPTTRRCGPDGHEAWFVLVNAPRHGTGPGAVDWDAPGLRRRVRRPDPRRCWPRGAVDVRRPAAVLARAHAGRPRARDPRARRIDLRHRRRRPVGVPAPGNRSPGARAVPRRRLHPPRRRPAHGHPVRPHRRRLVGPA